MTRLAGRVVANTREDRPGDPLTSLLEAEGAHVVVWPTISFGPPKDPGALARAREALEEGRYDWLVFTSARAVEPVLGEIEPVAGVRVAAVGHATADRVEAHGWPVAVTGEGDARDLARAVEEAAALDGARVLFPAASRAGRTLQDALEGAGARVDRVEAYRTLLTPPDAERVMKDLELGVDAVTFASPSAVRSLARALGADWPKALDPCGLAAIGPSTARALARAGVAAQRVERASVPGIRGLVEACVEIIRRRQR